MVENSSFTSASHVISRESTLFQEPRVGSLQADILWAVVTVTALNYMLQPKSRDNF
jgi:hypothetical protein